jgi:anti-repressor protein
MKLLTNELLPVYETDSGERVIAARELHEFLEVNSKFADWIKNRITKYGFEEGTDFTTVSNFLENGGRSIEYVLKMDVAKELCMVESNEKGSEARKYFIAIEKRFKSQDFDVGMLTPEMQMFKHMFDAVAKTQIEASETSRKLVLVENNISIIKETIIQREDNWRDSLNKMFNTAVRNSNGQDFQSMRNESYAILEERAHCDLSRRQRNMRDRLQEGGATKTKVNAVTKMDVIEDDPKLKEIYTSIVKELSVKNIKMNA